MVSGFNITRFKKATAVILSLLMIVVVLFSAYIITVKADHDCEGEDCHICECVEICIGILQKLGFNASVAVSVCAFSFITLFTVLMMEDIVLNDTPVTNKVRLNN